MACDEDEEKAAAVIEEAREADFNKQRFVPATYSENVHAVFGKDSHKEMDQAITELLEAQVLGPTQTGTIMARLAALETQLGIGAPVAGSCAAALAALSASVFSARAKSSCSHSASTISS